MSGERLGNDVRACVKWRRRLAIFNKGEVPLLLEARPWSKVHRVDGELLMTNNGLVAVWEVGLQVCRLYPGP